MPRARPPTRVGLAVLLVLLVMGLCVVLAFSATEIVKQTMTLGTAALLDEQMRQVAEAGVTCAEVSLYQNLAFGGAVPVHATLYNTDLTCQATVENNAQGSGALSSAWDNTPIPPGSVYVYSRCVSQSTQNKKSVGVRYRAVPFFHYAIFGAQLVALSGGVVDSFDSSNGAYPNGQANSNGIVGTNSSAVGGVSLGQGGPPTQVYGTVFIGPAGPPTEVVVGAGSSYTPNPAVPLTVLEPVVPPPAPGPALLGASAPAAPMTGTISPGLYDQLSFTGSVALQSGIYYFVNGVNIAVGATLTGPASGQARLYCSGNVLVQGAVNVGLPASNVQLIGTGNAGSWTIVNPGTMGVMNQPVSSFCIFAPQANVSIQGDMAGSVFAQKINLEGNFHYDRALQNRGHLVRTSFHCW